MDPNNFTPLPPSLNPDSTVNIPKIGAKKSHHIKLPDMLLFTSFVIFIISLGFWVQTTMLQPDTKATQKIIDATVTPSPTPVKEIPNEISPTISEIPE